ncbi:MAG: phytoene desaturase [Bacteroidales bacterium]|nr:phytoene desaturase [Bacteroidales bacterium]MCB8998921.1 phytoene desaturase [Bacteroidales bacterium]
MSIKNKTNKTAIIIGSGLGGIATAIRLSNSGINVKVFEAEKGPGGKLNQFSLGAYRFDLGPSLFTMPENVLELFRLAGKNPQDYFDFKEVPIACRYFFEDGAQINAYTNRQQFTEEVKGKTGLSEKKLNSYLDHSIWLYKLLAPVFIEKSLHKLRSYLSWKTVRAALAGPRLDIFTSMDKANMKRLGHPKLVQMFNRMATYNGSSPYLAPGILNIISSLEHGTGVFFPWGGMYSITTSLVRLAEELGVEFHYNEKVEKILFSDGRAAGVKTGKGEYLSDLVVSNMDIVPTYRKLLPDLKAPEKTMKQERSSSALVFYWGIKKKFPELDLHNIFFSDDYRKEFEFLFSRLDIYEDPTVYVNVSSKLNSADAPEGHENWFVMINAPHEAGQDWESIIAKIRLATITKLNRILKTDLSELIQEERILDPREIESLTSSFQGSLYGSSSNSKFSAFLRHPNFTGKLKGLYFVGGSVHPGGGIPLVLNSAKICAELISRDLS